MPIATRIALAALLALAAASAPASAEGYYNGITDHYVGAYFYVGCC